MNWVFREEKKYLIGMAEALQAEGVAADRPEAHVNRARLLQARGDGAAAGQALTMALRLDPAFVPALINLADLHRAAGRDGEAEGLLFVLDGPNTLTARAPGGHRPEDAAVFDAQVAAVTAGGPAEGLDGAWRAAAAACAVGKRISAAARRSGGLLVMDPRRTATAKLTDDGGGLHLQPTPSPITSPSRLPTVSWRPGTSCTASPLPT